VIEKIEKRFTYGVDKPMINFTEGKIDLCGKNILAASDEELVSCALKGIVEKRKDRVGTYYYFENEANNVRFGVILSLRNKRMDWARLSWLDSPVKDWDDVSDKAMMDEYKFLANLVEKEVGFPPDNKGNRKCTWRFDWGRIEVTYEPRAYQADIFMKPG
jgi:hypothetical protein